MITIDVSNSGEKRYVPTVIKGVEKPTKATRERDPAKALYEFNTMVDLDFMYAPDEKTRNAITQAFQSKIYAPARERGRLTTMSVLKSEKLKAQYGTGYGIWFEEWTEDEKKARAEKAAAKAAEK